MGDGEDGLESLSCPVLIEAYALRELVAQERKKEQDAMIAAGYSLNDTGEVKPAPIT